MRIYGAKGVIYPEDVTKKIEKIEKKWVMEIFLYV